MVVGFFTQRIMSSFFIEIVVASDTYLNLAASDRSLAKEETMTMYDKKLQHVFPFVILLICTFGASSFSAPVERIRTTRLSSTSSSMSSSSKAKGKVLVLGGTGFLGQVRFY